MLTARPSETTTVPTNLGKIVVAIHFLSVVRSDRLRASALSPDVIGPLLGEQVGAAAPNFDLKRLASDDRQSLPGFKAPAALALSQDSLDLDERGFLVRAGVCDGFLGYWRGGLFGNAAPWRGGGIQSPE